MCVLHGCCFSPWRLHGAWLLTTRVFSASQGEVLKALSPLCSLSPCLLSTSPLLWSFEAHVYCLSPLIFPEAVLASGSREERTWLAQRGAILRRRSKNTCLICCYVHTHECPLYLLCPDVLSTQWRFIFLYILIHSSFYK